MELRFIGTGSAFCPALGNNGAFLTASDTLCLIDCGEGTFGRLMQADLFAQFPGNITVLITHLHADHCGSLATLCLYAHAVLGRPVTVVYPSESIRTLLELMGVQEGQYTLQPALFRRALQATPIAVTHVPGMPAFGYLLSDDSRSIYYSGDSNALPEGLMESVADGKTAHVYQDVADTPPVQGAVHLPLQTLEELVAPALRDRFTLMHLNHDYHAKALKAGFRVATCDPLFAQG